MSTRFLARGRAQLLSRYSTTSSSSSFPHATPAAAAPPVVPVDELCIPLAPPYSIASYIPSPTPLSRETLTKLHRLSALEPPTTEEGWKELEQLGDLAAIIEGIRLVPTSSLLSGSQGQMVDGRVRGQAVELEPGSGGSVDMSDGFGRELLKLAEVTEGSYYTVPTPQNVRGKRRGSATVSEGSEA